MKTSVETTPRALAKYPNPKTLPLYKRTDLQEIQQND